jgi:hypothetical protein
MFSVVLYGCEIWCLKIREKHRVKILEKRVKEEVKLSL